MKRALLVAPLVPLAAIALTGLAAGYRSLGDLTQFVLIWAMFLIPLVGILGVLADWGGRRFGCASLCSYAVGGFCVSFSIGFSWFEISNPLNSPTEMLFCALVGGVGALTSAVFQFLLRDARRITSP